MGNCQIPQEAMPTSPAQLPGGLAFVAEIIAESLSEDMPDISAKAVMLAVRATFKVADAHRGTAIYCHNLGAWWRQFRDTLIVEEFNRRDAAGETATAIVRDLAGREWPGDQRRIGERQIWNILGKPDPRQGVLF